MASPQPQTAALPWHAGPLWRCLRLYAATPGYCALTLLLYLATNALLVWQQQLLGHALQEAGRGLLVLPSAQGLDLRPALAWLALLSAVAMGRAATQYGTAMLELLMQQRLLTSLRERILHQVQRLHLAYLHAQGVGEIVTRTTRDADKLREALLLFWRQGVDSLFVATAVIGFLCWVHPALAGVPLLLTLTALALLLRQADALVSLDRAASAAYDQVNRQLNEGVQGVRVIKAFSLQGDRVARFGEQVDRFVALSARAVTYAAGRIPLPQALVGFAQAWVLGWGLYLTAQGQVQAGPLVSALLAVNLLVLRIEGVGRVVQVCADARSSAARIWQLLDTAPAIRSGGADLPTGRWGLRLQGVCLKAPGQGRPLLEGVSLALMPGEVVALVGASGSGKSTLAALLPRLADPDGGRVQAGQEGSWVDLRTLDLAALRRRVQVVPQESFLFSDTVGDNLRLAAPGASDQHLFEALAIADADGFVRALPQGLETRLGDRGVTLSGGQRQRLCLARALLADPAVLVLDDATSALDPLTERAVLERLRKLHGHAGGPPAVLLVTNRLASLSGTDRVLLLEEGRLTAAGRHVDLARTNADYSSLMGIKLDG